MPDIAEKPRVWAWPSTEALAGMTLREQRRQYLIMASEARGKAGPMGPDGQHPRPEWIEKSKNFAAEAQYIAGMISKGAQAREDPDSPFRSRPAPARSPPTDAPMPVAPDRAVSEARRQTAMRPTEGKLTPRSALTREMLVRLGRDPNGDYRASDELEDCV